MHFRCLLCILITDNAAIINPHLYIRRIKCFVDSMPVASWHRQPDVTQPIVAALTRVSGDTFAALQRFALACRDTAKAISDAAELQKTLHLRRCAHAVETMHTLSLPELLALMRKYIEHAQLQTAALAIIACKSIVMEITSLVLTITQVMQAHSENPVVQNIACYAFERYFRDDITRMTEVAESDALEQVVGAEYTHGFTPDTHYKGFRSCLVPMQKHPGLQSLVILARGSRSAPQDAGYHTNAIPVPSRVCGCEASPGMRQPCLCEAPCDCASDDSVRRVLCMCEAPCDCASDDSVRRMLCMCKTT